MIKEVYCSFEVAKLLKEKGFDCPCHATYDTAVTGGKPKFFEYDVLQFFPNGMKNSDDKYGMVISAPTHQMAMAWLREYKIYIMIDRSWSMKDSWQYCICVNNDFDHLIQQDSIPNRTYEEAVEAALKYVLENLI